MSHLFTTDALPVGDRVDAWRWKAEQVCGDCRIKLPRISFHGSIDVRTIGDVKLTRFSSSPLAFWKWPGDTVKEENRSCIVITQLAGIRQYVQKGVSVLLKPGESTVIDSGTPWCSTCSTECTRLYFRVPRWMMQDRIRSQQIPIAQRITGKGLGATLCRLSQSLYDEAEHLSEQEGTAALDAYFSILTSCFGTKALVPTLSQSHSGHHYSGHYDSRHHSGHPGAEQRERIQQFIDMHLSEASMGPAEIASAIGISVRHLHRLFSGSGSSVGDYIRARRLEECRNDLADARLRERTITEIAFFWGFSDSAHFSRSFAKQFGTSPRDFRAQAAAKEEYSLRTDRVSQPTLAVREELGYSKPN